MTIYDLLPNPFLPHPEVGTAALANVATGLPGAGAADYFDSAEHLRLLIQEAQAALDAVDEPARFQLNEAALLAEIELVPALLTRPIVDEIEELLELARADQWPEPPVLRRTA